jgi:hypothetical protein
MTTYNQVAAFILTEASTKDLHGLIEAIKMRRTQIGRQNVRAFMPGSAVKFQSNRTGQVYQGTVTKVMQKNVIVQTAQGSYRVPASMLQPALGIGG